MAKASTRTERAPNGVATTLKLVQTKPKKSSAPRLRAGIIEGTCGKNAGPYPDLPADMQRALDRKARTLADEAFEVIRESLVRNVGCHCFFGLNYERFDAERALQLVADATLDEALAPAARSRLELAHSIAASFVFVATGTMEKLDAELRRLNVARKEGGAA